MDAVMRQSPGKLSTEARIYAKNLAYEIARRERIGAPMLDPGGKATTWRDAQVALRHAFMDEGSPPRRVKLLDAAATRLERLSPSDRGFRIALISEGSRQRSIFDLRMLVHGSHPLEGLEHESGVTALCATFTTKRSKRDAFDVVPSVYLSDHTIGRLRERSEQWSTPEAGLAALHIATVAADLARPDHRLSFLKMSSLSCAIDGGILTGAMRRSPVDHGTVPLWDVRTLLDDDFKLDPATVQQASQVAELVTRVLVGGENWMTISLQSRNSGAIDFVEPREDHVTATLRARVGVKN
ncbi:hypothetical protein [Mesorhizobium sp. WSM2561]|uniref:hypothetical protein n=1 Tax=Mesorhizobium sp. WSM2561 TaxID=1040985 RepID=UPI00048573CC|nr:hypothetical protein [Mesorhizobium sp. WSM2561]